MRLSSRLLSLAAILAALLLAACGDGDTTTNIAAPTTGTERFGAIAVDVVGNVVDTNGVPVAGARVSIASGQSATTDAAGQYRLENVPATGASDPVAGANPGTSCPNCTQALAVTIVPPVGYLGAAVSVNPSAVVLTGDSSGVVTGNGDFTVFIDDTLVGAGLAVLPATTAVVQGQIRNAFTGLPVVGLAVSLDFTALTNPPTNALPTPNEGINIAGNTISYIAAPANLRVTTDANGRYSFTNVPQDSTFNLGVSGSFFVINQVNNAVVAAPGPITVINTSQEGISNTFNLQVQEVASLDSVPPYITQVDGASRAAFAASPILKAGVDGVNNPIVIVFSEALAPATFGFGEIVVGRGTPGALTATFNIDFARTALSGNTLRIHTTTALARNIANLQVLVIRQKLQDPSQNLVQEPNPVPVPAPVGVFPPAQITSPITLPGGAPALTAPYLVLSMQTFTQATEDAQAAESLVQFAGTEGPVQTVEGSTDAFRTALSSFRSIAGVLSANLNSAANANDANIRLSLLARARGEPVASSGFLNNVIRLNFVTRNAAGYNLTVARSNGQDRAFVAHQADGTVIGSFDNDPGTPVPVYSAATNAADGFAASRTNAFVVLSGVQASDVITITPVNGIGVAGTPQSFTVVDVVPPTTTLQASYGLNPGVAGGVAGTASTNGGQLINPPGTPGGSPILALTTVLLANQQANIPWTGRNAALTGAQYDATSYNATTFVRTFGAAFSEPVAFTATGRADVQARVNAGALSTLLTVDGIQNNLPVTAPAPGQPAFADVVALTGDVQRMSFALSAAGQEVDFDAAIQDLATPPNVAAQNRTNASVIIQERIPPLVRRAYYTGDRFVVEFNEPISSTWTSVSLAGKPIARGAPGVSLANNNMQIEVNLLAAGAVDISSADFGAPRYAEQAAYTGIAGVDAAGDKNHAFLDFSGIADAKTATTWNAQGVAPPPVASPVFAAIDLLGPFTGACVVPAGGQFTSNTTVVGGTARNLSAQRVRCTFSHPLLDRTSARLAGLAAADSLATVIAATTSPNPATGLQYNPAATVSGDFLLDVGDVASFFGVVSNAAPPVARAVTFTGSNVLSADRRSIDFNFTVTGGVQADDRFVLNTGAVLRSAFIPVSDLAPVNNNSRFVMNPAGTPGLAPTTPTLGVLVSTVN